MKLYIKSLIIILFPLVLFVGGSRGLTVINNWSAQPAAEVFEVYSKNGVSGEIDEETAKIKYGIDLSLIQEEIEHRKNIRNGAMYFFIALMLFALAKEAKWLSRKLST